MKKRIFFGLLGLMYFVGHAMVQLPDSKTLEARLKEHGFEYFAKRTQLVNNLADKEMLSVFIMREVDTSATEFGIKIRSSNFKNIFMQSPERTDLIKLLINDKAIIEELQKNHLL